MTNHQTASTHQDADFAARHIGPDESSIARMLQVVGYESLDALTEAVVPDAIKWRSALRIPEAISERATREELKGIAGRNIRCVNMIGLGYSDTQTPGVILRNIIESPSWYTAYTPYQPEISQGRLEALLNFQTMIEDLTALPVAGSSLLDEPTAAAEAMTLCLRSANRDVNRFLVDADTHPQTLAVLATRAEPIGIDLVIADLGNVAETGLPEGDFAGVLFSYPGTSGRIRDPRPVIDAAHERGALAVVAAALLGLTLLTPPGEMGADIVVGSAQRFGVPLGFGGPHAGFMAVRAGLERRMPGRLVGVSVDADGAPAYRLALQTREQHIRREKATSNICTAQVLLAVVAAMYAAYHGPTGLTEIARRANRQAAVLAAGIVSTGGVVHSSEFFDTVRVSTPGVAHEVVAAAFAAGVNIRLVDEDTVSVSTDELTMDWHVEAVWGAYAIVSSDTSTLRFTKVAAAVPVDAGLPAPLRRTSPILTHPVFNDHHSETSMLRYLRRLADRDIALDRSMIPLGSCTMKLNATTEMEPVTWPEFAGIHPFAPLDQAQGYLELIGQLESWLVEITGYDAVTLQPNAGSQGEFAGLLALRGYHHSRGETFRDVCLIPSSAHGTNAASAVMAGMRVVVISCDERGNVDIEDLRMKINEHRAALAVLMITYPSTHGVFESAVVDICAMVHEAGGQVYVDGANLNALVGLAKPGKFGADVSHLNLHKTFCIPHGGGGPGMGPIGVKAHLAPFLPGHCVQRGSLAEGVGAVSAAPWGSPSILPISWAYIAMMGGTGLLQATQVAILNANYIAKRLDPYFPVLYSGPGGLVAHECIIDLRAMQTATIVDVAKRLVDFGIHAPTMSFPVSGTLMIEPTESESKVELDRFCDAMIAIATEVDEVESGVTAIEDSPLHHAPHTLDVLMAADWNRPYTREDAAFPLQTVRDNKYWPPVGRIDQVYGDRHVICACPPLDAYQDAAD